MTTSQQLQQVIEERTTELGKYAQKFGASDFYIDEENNLIESLIEIYNGIEPLYYQDLWVICEKLLLQFKKMDANFSGLNFQIRFKSEGVLSLQELNLFDDET